MLITLPWDHLRSSPHTRGVTRMPDCGTCPAAEDCRYKADQDSKQGIFKVRELHCSPRKPYARYDTDDVLYLTALLPEDQSLVVPRLSGLIPDCGAWIRSRSYVEPGTARFVFEFPRDICVEIYSALVSVGLQLTASSHLLLTELCRCTPHVFDLPSRKLPAVDGATLDAATRYICSLEIIKVQLQIWMVKEEELKLQLGEATVSPPDLSEPVSILSMPQAPVPNISPAFGEMWEINRSCPQVPGNTPRLSFPEFLERSRQSFIAHSLSIIRHPPGHSGVARLPAAGSRPCSFPLR